LLAKEVHRVALRQQPLDEVADLALTAAMEAKGAFDQTDLHCRMHHSRSFS
jgi:hypothetical protein